MLLGPRVGGITNGARGAMMGSGQETRTGSPYANSAYAAANSSCAYRMVKPLSNIIYQNLVPLTCRKTQT